MSVNLVALHAGLKWASTRGGSSMSMSIFFFSFGAAGGVVTLCFP